jgi:hypothetical protein
MGIEKNRVASGAGWRRSLCSFVVVVGSATFFAPRYRLQLTANPQAD